MGKYILSVCLFFVTGIVCAQVGSQYEYLSLAFFDNGNYIVISDPGNDVEVIETKDEKSKKAYDLTPLLKRIEEYEKLGWEYTSFNINNHTQGYPGYIALMRRIKEE